MLKTALLHSILFSVQFSGSDWNETAAQLKVDVRNIIYENRGN
jgi:hypothetical protein